MKVLLMTIQSPPPTLESDSGKKHFSKVSPSMSVCVGCEASILSNLLLVHVTQSTDATFHTITDWLADSVYFRAGCIWEVTNYKIVMLSRTGQDLSDAQRG